MNTVQIIELTVVMTRNANVGLRIHEISGDVAKLKRLAARSMTRSLRMCNDADYSEDRQEKDRNAIVKALGTIFDGVRYSVTGFDVGGDPRGGSVLLIKFTDGSRNGWNDGWSV